jgi:hypothetical protein
VKTLTPVLLRSDTRVTNHGYAGGRATPHQSVLQAGTAVLVDSFGVPRVRCACGNPLAPPAPTSSPVYTGTRWPGFSETTVIVIAPTSKPVTGFVLIDVRDDKPFGRPVATQGGRDVDAVIDDGTPGSAPTTTTRPPVTTTTTAPAPPQDITGAGSGSATSEYPGGEYPAALALDGNPQTSWFSDGSAGGGTEVFTWQAPNDFLIDSVTVAANRDPAAPLNFGFASLVVHVYDAAGNETFSQPADLPGTPDPDITVNPGVRGSRVAIEFIGHESSDCGGFGGLSIVGRPVA